MAMPAQEPTAQDLVPATANMASLLAAPKPVDATGQGRLLLEPRPRFFLWFTLAAWEVVSEGLSGPRLLPVLVCQPVVPGANGIRTRAKNEAEEASWVGGIKEWADKGRQLLDPNRVIPASCLPPGVPEGPYIREIPCAHPRYKTPGSYFCEAWDVPNPPTPGMPQSFKRDRGAYNRWRASLVDEKVVPGPPDAVVQNMLRNADRAINRTRISNAPADVRDERVKDAKAKKASIEAAAKPPKKAA